MKGVDVVYEGLSLLMHVFDEAVVWLSDFRLQRLCALWSQVEVEDGNLITEHQPISSVKGYTACLSVIFFTRD